MARGFSRLFFPRRKGEIVRHWSVRGSEALEMGNAPFLEASRRSWKWGGARSQEEYKGAQDAKRLVGVFWVRWPR